MTAAAGRPFRVTFVSHSKEVGGTERHLEGLLAHLQQGFVEGRPGQPVLVCRRDQNLDTWVARIEAAGIRVHRLDLKRPGEVVRLFRLLRAADLVHLMLAYPVGKYQFAAAVMSRLAQRPLVITHHLVLDISRPGVWTRLFRRYGRLAQRHVAVSISGRDLLIERYGFPQAAVQVIYTGVDASAFRPLSAGERGEVRDAIVRTMLAEQGGGRSLVVLTVARLSIQKGLLDLVEAAAEITRRRSDVRFIVIGEGDQRAELTRRIGHRGLSGQLILAGERPAAEVARLLAAGDVFALPSHFEGIPLSLLEAMAAGCPPVATAVGGIPEVITDDGVGVLVEPRQPARLAAAILGLLERPDQRARMAEAARARVIDRFDREAGYARTLSLYAELTDRSG